MKLLIVTQKVDKNDPVLGFFHGWIEEFAKKCQSLVVICLSEGQHDLPANVKVLSLGKEKGFSKLMIVTNFYRYIWNERKNYDVVFVHMNQIYVVLGGLFWRLAGKKIGLWYVHRQVSLSLRVAAMLSNVIFTSAKESFGIVSEKVRYVGHGIDIASFAKPADYTSVWPIGINRQMQSVRKDVLQIVHVGRITPIKHCEVLIEAMGILRDEYHIASEAVFIGAPTNDSDREYFAALKKNVAENNLNEKVAFIGSLPNSEVKKYYWEADISVNMCPDGGMDKTVLESMAAGTPTFASNKIFADVLGELGQYFMFKFNDPKSLAEKINGFWSIDKADINLDMAGTAPDKTGTYSKEKIIAELVKISKGFDVEKLAAKLVVGLE